MTASADNHALGIARAAGLLGRNAIVVVSETASAAKLEALLCFDVRLVGASDAGPLLTRAASGASLRAMVVTVPLSRRRSLVIAWTGAGGLHCAVWRGTCGDLPYSDDDPGGASGVREPRSPHPPRPGAAVAMRVDT